MIDIFNISCDIFLCVKTQIQMITYGEILQKYFYLGRIIKAFHRDSLFQIRLKSHPPHLEATLRGQVYGGVTRGVSRRPEPGLWHGIKWSVIERRNTSELSPHIILLVSEQKYLSSVSTKIPWSHNTLPRWRMTQLSLHGVAVKAESLRCTS